MVCRDHREVCAAVGWHGLDCGPCDERGVCDVVRGGVGERSRVVQSIWTMAEDLGQRGELGAGRGWGQRGEGIQVFTDGSG